MATTETPKTAYDENAEAQKKANEENYKDVYDDADGKKKGYVLDFHDQCFLMDFASKFANIKGGSVPWAPRHVAEVMGGTDPKSKTFNSYLTPKSSQVLFSNKAPVQKLWNITPQLRLYKIKYDSNGKERRVRLPFRQEITKDRIKNLTDPGNIDKYYANIEEFSFNYEGVNPAEVDYYITANLRLYFNNVEAFFYNFNGASYSDLIKRPKWNQPSAPLGSDSLDRHRQWNENFFRIWVEVDYDLDGIPQEEKNKHKEFFGALKDQKIAFYLNILKHEFEIDKMPGMPFYLNIDYVAAVESSMNNREFADILGRKMSGPAISSDLLQRRSDLEKAMQGYGLQEFASMQPDEAKKLFRSAFAGLDFSAGEVTGMGGYGSEWNSLSDERKSALLVQADIDFREELQTHPDGPGSIPTSGDVQAAHHFSYNEIKKRFNEKTENKYSGDDLMKRIILSSEYWNVRNQIEKEAQEASVDQSTRYTLLHDELFGRGSLGLNDEDLASAGYNKEKIGTQDPELMTKVDSNVVAAARRVYSITVPGKEMHDYIYKKKTYKERVSQDTIASLKAQEELGDPSAHRQLQNIRKGAQQTMRNGLNSFWKRNFEDKNLIINYAGIKDLDGPLKGTGQESVNYTKEVKEKVAHDARQSTGNGSSNSSYPSLGRYLRPIAGSDYYLQWMYFGDIVDAALSIVRGEQKQLGIVIPSWYFWGGTGEKYTGNQVHDASYNVVFGNITYDDNLTGKRVTIPISKIPVSLKLFNEFWTQYVVGPGLDHYPFKQFLKDLLTYVMSNCFTSRCAQPGEVKNRIRGAYDVITQKEKWGQSTIKIILPQSGRNIIADHCPKAVTLDKNNNAVGPFRKKLIQMEKNVNDTITMANSINTFGEKIPKYVAKKNWSNAASANTVIYIYATSNNVDHLETPAGRTILQTNIKNNITHIKLGQTTPSGSPYKYKSSPIKEISFSKTDQPFYLEAKGDQAGIKDNPLELSEPYNVTMTLFGNMAFRPGSHFYLMLPQMGNPMYKKLPDGRKEAIDTYANQLGLGGYFMVTKCQNTISAAGQKFEWETEVSALWVGYPEKSTNTTERATETTEVSPTSVGAWLDSTTNRFKEVLSDETNAPIPPPPDPESVSDTKIKVKAATDLLADQG